MIDELKGKNFTLFKVNVSLKSKFKTIKKTSFTADLPLFLF